MNKKIKEALEKVKEYAPEINAIGFNSNELNEDNTIFNNAIDTLKKHINELEQEVDRYKVSVIPNYYNIMKSQQSKLDSIEGMLERRDIPMNDIVMLSLKILKEEKK
jgi:chromosome segregation ATPase